MLINRHRFRSKRQPFPVTQVSRGLGNSRATNLLCLEEAISITQAPLPSAVTHAWKWYCFSTECRQHWGFSAPKLHTPAFLSEQKCLFKIVLMVRFMSYLAWSQQVTNWLCTTSIKTCKPDAPTLIQKSISRLSSTEDLCTFIKCLCLSSSDTQSSRLLSQLTSSSWIWVFFGSDPSLSECRGV